MRSLSCFLSFLKLVGSASFLISAHALGQKTGGYTAEPSKPGPKLETVVTACSPEETQDRQFAGSRLWRLDPGQYEVEVWWDQKFQTRRSSGSIAESRD